LGFHAGSEHHPMFTPDEKRAISDDVIHSYIIPGLLITDATFATVRVLLFLENYKNSEPSDEFQFHPGSISDFKRKNRFSSPGAHLKHRPTVGIADREYWVWTLVQFL
jgi:hypothetical protein